MKAIVNEDYLNRKEDLSIEELKRVAWTTEDVVIAAMNDRILKGVHG